VIRIGARMASNLFVKDDGRGTGGTSTDTCKRWVRRRCRTYNVVLFGHQYRKHTASETELRHFNSCATLD
jgi:hypothetical protein